MGFETRGWNYEVLAIRKVGGAEVDQKWAAMNAVDPGALWEQASPAPRKFFPAVCGLTELQDHVIVPGTRGSRDLFPDQTVKGNRVAGGPLRFKFGREDLDYWLPCIYGAEESSNVFKVDNVLPWFHLLIKKSNEQFDLIHEYRDCKIQTATFSGVTGGVVNMDLDIVCRQEEEYAGSFDDARDAATAFSPTLSTRPLRFAEGFCSVDGIEAKFEQFACQTSNSIQSMFYAGSDAFTEADEGYRITTLAIPAAHANAVKALYKRGFEGLAGILKFEADNMSTRWDFPKLFWPKQSTTMRDEGPTRVPLQMRAYRSEAGDSGADDSVKVTNDPVFSS